MSDDILISIVIPTFNRVNVLEHTLKSVKHQTYTNWECLVVDDGSTDNTSQLIKHLVKNDNRFKYFDRPLNKPKGANACRNYGLKKSKGNFIVFFDSDDYMYPQFLELQFKNLHKTDTNYCICKSEWKTKEGKLINGFQSDKLESDDRINDYISFKIFWPIHSVMYNKLFLNSNNLVFDESLQQSQEYDFHVKVMSIDVNYAILDKVLVRVIASANSISYSTGFAFSKARSSLRVRNRFLFNKKLKLKFSTREFLLYETHRIYMQQTMRRNVNVSIYAAFYYLKVHFCDMKIFAIYFHKHFFPVLISVFSYNLFGKGYIYLKKSNRIVRK